MTGCTQDFSWVCFSCLGLLGGHVKQRDERRRRLVAKMERVDGVQLASGFRMRGLGV